MKNHEKTNNKPWGQKKKEKGNQFNKQIMI
jgi:hypothetical protein